MIGPHPTHPEEEFRRWNELGYRLAEDLPATQELIAYLNGLPEIFQHSWASHGYITLYIDKGQWTIPKLYHLMRRAWTCQERSLRDEHDGLQPFTRWLYSFYGKNIDRPLVENLVMLAFDELTAPDSMQRVSDAPVFSS